jgi:short-subunit dehydrogenase
MSYENKTGVALVTGASSGIGGYDLIVVARDEARLEALSKRLVRETGRTVKPLRADLTDNAELANVERVLREEKAVTTRVATGATGARLRRRRNRRCRKVAAACKPLASEAKLLLAER